MHCSTERPRTSLRPTRPTRPPLRPGPTSSAPACSWRSTLWPGSLTALVVLGIRRRGPGLWWSAVCVDGWRWARSSARSAGSHGGHRDPGPGRARDLGPAPARPGIARCCTGRSTSVAAAAAFALVPLFLLWANLDESFVVGLIVLAAAVAGLGLTRSRCGDAEALSWPAGLAVLAACAVACLANPSFHRVYPGRAGADRPTVPALGGRADAMTSSPISASRSGRDELGKGLGGHLVAYYLLFVGLGLGSFVLNRRHFSLSRFLMFAVAAVLWGALIRFDAAFAVVFAATVTLNGQEWYHDRFGTRGRLGRGWAVWSIGGRRRHDHPGLHPRRARSSRAGASRSAKSPSGSATTPTTSRSRRPTT